MKKISSAIIFILTVLACNSEEVSLTGIVQSTSDDEPLSNIKVYVFKNRKPMYGLWRFPLVDSSKTNMKGEFKFKVKDKGYYSFEFYDGYDRLHGNDSIEIKELNDTIKLYFKW